LLHEWLHELLLLHECRMIQVAKSTRELRMNKRATQVAIGMGILLLPFLILAPLHAQTAQATLSGTIADPSGKAVPNAKVSVKNVATGQTAETQTDSAGLYEAQNLAPGDYEITVAAEGFSSNVAKVTMAGASQSMNVTLGGVLSLEDLGYAPGQAQGTAQDQARLDKRSHMLKIHQRIGLIATAPIVASVVTGLSAGGKSTSSTDRYAHAALGAVSADLYFISAYYAIRAPRIPGTQAHGPIRLHKALAWIHGPGMILTPILGAIAFDQKSRGEKVHGIASAHAAVAIITAGAYGASILSVSIKF
jgi:hypothetical protein